MSIDMTWPQDGPPDPSSSWDSIENKSTSLVDNTIWYLRNQSISAFNIAKEHIEEIENLMVDLDIPDISDIAIASVSIDPIDYDNRPSLSDLDIPDDWPEKDFTVELKTVTPIAGVSFPVFDITAPTFEAPEKPTINMPADPDDAPDIDTTVDLPTKPDLDLPDPPSLDDIVIPDAPEITLDSFDETLLPWNVDDPAQFTWDDPTYDSDVYSDLLAKILNDIQHGGTGLSEAVEQELYDRFLARTFTENERLYTETENYFAARGFTLPPGMLAAALNETNQQISRNNMEASREIHINQAELAQKNTHFILELGTKLEGMMREFFINQANLSLQGQRAVAEHSIALYNAAAEKHRYYLEEYKTKADVWEAGVRAAMVEIEIFKGKIEGARVSADVQRTLVDIYNAQLNAANTIVGLYTAQMEGERIKAQINELKIRVYAEQIRAYVARIEGETAKMGMYEVEYRGEAIKAEVYQSRVQAFGAEVDAKAKELGGQIAELEATLKENAGLIDKYKADAQVYSTDVDAVARKIDAVVTVFQGEVSAYNADSGREEAYLRTKVAEMQTRIDEARFNMQQAIAEVEAAIRGFEAVGRLRLEGNTGVMNVGAQLAASAMNAINTSASIGYSGSESAQASVSQSWQQQLARSESLNISGEL